MDQYFWLLCGLWCGLGGGIYTWFSLRKHVSAGTFSRHEVVRFSKGLTLWVLIPSLILWLLQLSIEGNSTPMYLSWPYPQKGAAFALQGLVWAALLYYVFFNGGAMTVSKYFGATNTFLRFLHSPLTIKFVAIAAVVSGVAALMSGHA
jgi:hypothetical protein